MGSPGEFYWNGAYGTLWWADPVEDLAVVFMAQVPGEQRRRYRPLVNALVYQALTV
jgi:CubicO group peptidase (beta-lactamase class C family)